MVPGIDSNFFKPKETLLELSLINAETSHTSFDNVVVEALERDMMPEIVTRSSEMWQKEWTVGGELIRGGMVIVTKISGCLIANPKIAIDAALSACATMLVASVPFIGPLLAPLAAGNDLFARTAFGSSATPVATFK